jgi:hypothetical protein
LKLLAQGLRFIDPVTGQERVFESEIKLEGWNVGPGGEIPRRYRV